MKRYLLILLVLSSVMSCEKDNIQIKEVEPDISSELEGTWQLIAYSYSIGTVEQIWKTTSNGYTLELKSNGVFESDRIENCWGGTYAVQGDSLMLDFECKTENIQYIDHFSLQNDVMLLNPISPHICIEGCSYKLKKQSTSTSSNN